VGAVDECLGQVELAAFLQVLGERSQHFLERPLAHPALESPMACLIRRIATRQVLPRRASPEDPKHAVHDVARIAEGSATPIVDRGLFVGQQRANELPLLVGEVHIQVRSENDPPVDPAPESDRILRC